MPADQNIVREHDKLYLSEDRKNNPKEYFKFIVKNAAPFLDQISHIEMLDIGCATGDFVYFLKSKYPGAMCTGIDVLPELLERATVEVSDCHFQQANICDESSLPLKTYDAVFMNGVHSIFNDLESWLPNAIKLVKKPGGKLFIFGIFNPDDIDVLLQVRSSAQGESQLWQSGWNVFSVSTFENTLKKLNVSSYYFSDFTIEIDIPKNKSDPLRSWTFNYDDGTKGVINGAMVLHKFMLLEVTA